MKTLKEFISESKKNSEFHYHVHDGDKKIRVVYRAKSRKDADEMVRGHYPDNRIRALPQMSVPVKDRK